MLFGFTFTVQNLNNMAMNYELFSDEQRNNPIYKILNSTTDGKQILKYYLTHDKRLKRYLRNLMSRLILKHECDNHFNQLTVDGEPNIIEKFIIPGSRFTEVSNLITELFPCESPITYYQAAKKGRNPRGGILWDHYTYKKKVFKEYRILRCRSIQSLEQLYLTDATELEKLEWLKTHLDPKETVLQYWNDTFKARKYILQGGISTPSYFNDFKALGVNQGIELIKADFSRLYPHNIDSFDKRWPTIKRFLITKFQECSDIKDLQDKSYADLLPTLLNQNQDTVIAYLLPYLLKEGKSRRINNENQVKIRKITIKERRNSFMIHVEKPEHLQTVLRNRREELRAAGLTLQPILYFVGPLITISASGFIFNDTIYSSSSPSDAIDCCFQAYQSLNCNYPERARMLWLFIQKCIYEINLPEDKISRSLSELMGEV